MQKYSKTVTVPEGAGLAGLVRIMNGTATEDISFRGVGMDDLQAKGLTWVLMQTHLKVGRTPNPGEELLSVTWPTESRLGIYPRCNELIDSAGSTVASMLGMWVVMDMSTRALADWTKVSIDLGADVSPERLRPERRIHMPEGGTMLTFTPESRHIDINQHFNNAAYVEIMEQYLPFSPKAMHIDFEHEILFGQTVSLRTVQTDDGTYFEGVTDKPCFKAVFR